MTGSTFDEVMQRMASNEPYHSATSGHDAIGEKLMSLLRGVQLSPSCPEGAEGDGGEGGPRPGAGGVDNGLAPEDIRSSSCTFGGSCHIEYSRGRLLDLDNATCSDASTSGSVGPLPIGLKNKLDQYPALRPKRMPSQRKEKRLPEPRKKGKKAKKAQAPSIAFDLPVLPTGLAFTYDSILGVWIPRSRPEDAKGV